MSAGFVKDDFRGPGIEARNSVEYAATTLALKRAARNVTRIILDLSFDPPPLGCQWLYLLRRAFGLPSACFAPQDGFGLGLGDVASVTLLASSFI